MADLWKSMVKPSVNDNKGEFFDPYDTLNTAGDDINGTVLLGLQIRQLQTMEKQKNYNIVNSFLKTVNVQQDGSEESESEAVSKIIEYINRAFASSNNSAIYTGRQVMGRDGKMHFERRKAGEKKQIVKETTILLQSVLNELQLNGTVSSALVNTLQSMLSTKFNRAEYIQEKAAEIEDLGIEILEKHGFSALATGSFYNAGKQLIEDGLAVRNGSKKLGNGNFYFTATVDGTTETVSGFKTFNEFFEKAKAFGGNARIDIPNELYDALKVGSDIKLQAKSGINQALLNAQSTGRNAISLQELGFGMDDENCRTLKKFIEWATKFVPYILKDPQSQSQTMTMLSNYHLSKNIAKTSLKANNLYLSEHGFQTASQWMQTSQQLLLFKPAVTKYIKDELGQPHSYAFTKI